jgi:hypothetical protein
VHGEDLLINDGSNWQAVEAVGKCLPKLDVVPPLALIIEPIDSIDRCALVVASKNEKVLRVFDLVGKQEADGLKRLLSSIDVVAKEQVVCFRWESSVFEEAQKVVVLPVNVTADLKGVFVSLRNLPVMLGMRKIKALWHNRTRIDVP